MREGRYCTVQKVLSKSSCFLYENNNNHDGHTKLYCRHDGQRRHCIHSLQRNLERYRSTIVAQDKEEKQPTHRPTPSLTRKTQESQQP